MRRTSTCFADRSRFSRYFLCVVAYLSLSPQKLWSSMFCLLLWRESRSVPFKVPHSKDGEDSEAEGALPITIS